MVDISREEYESRHKETKDMISKIDAKMDKLITSFDNFRINHFEHFKDDVNERILEIENNVNERIGKINGKMMWYGGAIAGVVFMLEIILRLFWK